MICCLEILLCIGTCIKCTMDEVDAFFEEFYRETADIPHGAETERLCSDEDDWDYCDRV